MVRRQSFRYQNDQRDRRTMSEIDRENEDYIFEEEESKQSETDDFEPTGGDDDDDAEEYDELDNGDDDDDDDDFDPSVARRPTTSSQQKQRRRAGQRTSPRKASAGRSSQQNYADSSSDDDDEEEEEIEEEFFVDGVPVAPPTSRRKQQQQRKPAAKPKKKSPPVYRDDDSSEEEEEAGDDGDDDKNDEDFEEEDANDDDDHLEFDEDEEEYRPRAKRPPGGSRPRGRPRKKANKTDSDDDDEEYNPRASSSSRKKNSASKKKKQQSSSKPAATKKRGRPRKNPPKEEESESDFVEEEDEDVKPAAKRKRGRPRKNSIAAKRKRGRPSKNKKIESDDEDDDDEEEFELDEDDEEVIVTTASSNRRGRGGRGAPAQRRRKPSRRNNKSSSEEFEISDDDDEDSNNNGGGGDSRTLPRRTRFSAAQATRRLSQLNEDDSDNDSKDDDDDGEEVAAAQNAKKRSKKKRKELSSDEEFLADSTSEPSIEEAQFDSESDNGDDSNVEEDQDLQTNKKAVNIDNEEVGTAESSSDDDGDDGYGNKKQSSRGKEILPENSQIHDSDDASLSDSEPDRAFTGAKQPRMPQCPSTEDCITAEPLPKNHVCCVSPDGSSRECFALETLRTIALKSNTLFKRVDLDGEERMTFLQPPHFRTKMSDDLLDQISSRFGRPALDLHGNFYNRKVPSRTGVSHNIGDIFLPNAGMLDDEEELLGRVRRYMDSQMGTQDIYACPLCYREMHRRVYKSYRIKPADEKETDEDDDDEEEEDGNNRKPRAPSENFYDPILVLGWLDNEKFEGASAFCFTKVAELKQHLRNDHNVDTRNIDGNDLYMRFKVRAPDGLLQRYIKHCSRGIGNTFQGEMRIYWNEGNNQSFIYLLDLMERAKFYSHVLSNNEADEDDRDVATNYLSTARHFFESFIDRAKEEWKAISTPFLKAAKEDLNDFLVADGDVEEEEEEEGEGETGAAAVPGFLAHREVDMKADDDEGSDQNDLVHRIERKYAASNNRNKSEPPSDAEMSDADSDDLPSVRSDEDDDAKEVYSEVSDIHGYYSEVEDEKDDWITGIQSKRRAKGGRIGINTAHDADDAKTPTSAGKKLTKRRNSSQSSNTPASTGSQVTPASKRLSIQEDSDDE